MRQSRGEPIEVASAAARGALLGARVRRALWGYALVLPALAIVLGLLVYPIVWDLTLSLTDAHDFDGSGSFVGLANYGRAFSDPTYWEAARNTVALVAVTALVEVALGLATALLLWWRFWGRALVFLAVFVPWAYPSSFSAFAWYWLLQPPFHAFYTLDALAVRFWLEGFLGNGAWGVFSIGLMSIWRGSSIIAIFLLAGLNAIPDELLDYGRLESRSTWRYLWSVVLPLIRRYLVLAILIGITITYLDYVSMYVETGGRIIVPVVGTLVYQHGIMGGQTAYAAALGMTQLPVALLLVVFGLRMIERRTLPSASTAAAEETWTPVTRPAPPVRAALPAPARRLSSRAWRARRRMLAGAGAIAALTVMVFHLFPVYYTGVQAVRPLNEFHMGQIFWAYHPDLTGIQDAFQNRVLLQWAANTLIVFGSVLVIGLTLALLAGYGLARFDVPGARWLARLMFFCYFIPQMSVILPMFQIFNALGLDNTIPGIVLLYLTLTIPFTTWLFYVYFLGLDREVEEHAWLDGNRRQAFVHVVLPMSWPVVIAAGLFAVGMMGSDVLYSGIFTLSNSTKTLPAGLGITAIDLDEWANVSSAILLASLPIIVGCAALGRYYVRGLRAALLEGA